MKYDKYQMLKKLAQENLMTLHFWNFYAFKTFYKSFFFIELLGY